MVEQLKWLTLALIGLFSSPLVPRAASCCWPWASSLADQQNKSFSNQQRSTGQSEHRRRTT